MRIKSLLRKNFIFIYSISTAFCLICTGCGSAKEAEDEAIIVVSGEEEGYAYTLETVKKGNVVLTKSLNCTYVQAKEQSVAFSESGKTIEKIYVREGDYVNKGDILAEVSLGTLEEDIAALEYEIAKNELQLGYLDAHEEFDLTDSYYSLAYRSACQEEDVEDWEERNEDIEQSYSDQREDYSDALEFDRAKLAKLKAQLDSSRLYADIDGMVYTLQRNLEGTTSTRDAVIMTIIDGSEGMFVMEEPEYMQYFHAEDVIKLNITYGSAEGEYEVTPYQMDTWDQTQYFTIVDGPDNEGIEVDTKASITMVLDEIENAIYLPNDCIYKADDKFYVYVLDEQNMQTACFIEIGLVGDTYTEIVSGLNEGDTVVKR